MILKIGNMKEMCFNKGAVATMFLAILNYKMPFEETQKYVQAHREYLETQYQDKKLIVSGPMSSKTGGVILFNVESREEVDRIIANDPYYTNQVADYQVVEFSPVKSDPLFRENFI
jgi:uncharacterized protein YciI